MSTSDAAFPSGVLYCHGSLGRNFGERRRSDEIGQTFTPVAHDCAVGEVDTWLQSEYTVPTAGVITKWNFEASPNSAQRPSLKFKVARPSGGNNFTIIGESAVVVPAIGTLSTFSVQISVEPGDVIGFSPYTSGYCDRPQGGYTELRAVNDVSPINTATFSNVQGYQMDLSAVIEPDCDRDGLGDETQDQNLSTCPTCKGKRATIVGTRGKDMLTGTDGRDVMVGLAGNDELTGLGGNDVMCGGAGKDHLTGGTGNDALLGGGGYDACKGGKGKDSASGCEKRRRIADP